MARDESRDYEYAYPTVRHPLRIVLMAVGHRSTRRTQGVYLDQKRAGARTSYDQVWRILREQIAGVGRHPFMH
jgi:hypothetical protein